MTKEGKPDRLRQMGALNPKPEGVRAPLVPGSRFL